MTGDNVEALCAAVATINIAQSTEETRFEDKSLNKPSSTNPSETPTRIVTRRVPHSHLKSQLNTTNEKTATNTSTRPRKDSHSGNDNSDSTNESSQVDTLKSELERLKQQNDDLQKEAERYKVDLERARLENFNIEHELQNERAELAACRQELEFVKRESLYGTDNINFKQEFRKLEGIRFDKVYDKNDLSTTVTVEAVFSTTFSKTFTLESKTFRKDGVKRETYDKGAVSLVYISGKLYAAKCGKQQYRDMFIDKKRWTEAVMLLSKVIEFELDWEWAQHAELQLIAFYLGQVFAASGFTMVDVRNAKAYNACPILLRPVTIYVDQEVCWYCEQFVRTINEITDKHRLKFTVTNTGQHSFFDSS